MSAAGGGQAVDMNAVGLEEKLVVTGALELALVAAFWPKGRR